MTFDLWPWITIGIFLLSWWSLVPSCKILELMVQPISCLLCFPTVTIRPWPLTTNLEKQLSSSSHHVDQLYQVVWSWSLRFILYPAYNVFLLCDNTTLTFDQRPWKRISIFLSSWWSIVPSSMIMELTDHCVSSLQQFPTMWQMTLTFDLGLWNTIGIFLSSFKRFCLQDPDRQKTTLYHNTSL